MGPCPRAATGHRYTGSVFRLSTDGTYFETLRVLTLDDGAYPAGPLVQLADGSIYGVTSQGGSTADPGVPFWGNGTVYALDVGIALRIDLAADPSVNAGNFANFMLTLRNTSNGALRGPFTVTLDAFAGLQYAGDSADGWSCTGPDAARACTWAGDLAPGAQTTTHSVLYQVAATPPFAQDCGLGPQPCVAVRASLSNGVAPVTARSQVLTDNPGTGQPNNSPIAVDDTADVYDVFGVTVYPLQNDSDPDGDALKVIGIVRPPAAGEATIDPDGTSIYYSPFAPLTAPDTLLYRVEDSAGASVVAKITFNPRPVQLAPVKESVDIGNIAQGSLVSAWALVRGVPPGMTGTVRFETVDGTQIDSALAGTTHDRARAVSDPAAFGALDWTHGSTDATGPLGLAYIFFNPLSSFGQVSVARAVLETTISTGPVSTSFYVVGESADPAVTPPRAIDDAATTPAGTPVDVHVLANDLDVRGGGLQVYQPWKCPNLIEHVYSGVPCGSIHGTLLMPLDPATNRPGQIVRFTPDPGFTGQASTYYGMSDYGMPESVTDWNSLFYYARVTFDVGGRPTYSLTIAPTPTGGSVSGNGLACGNGGTTCQVTFGSATTVTLTATPASGYVFTSWGGSCAGTSATTTVLVDAAKTCSATFTASGGPVNGPPYTMTITPPTGGKVAGAGIDCGAGGALCSVTMPARMNLGIVATPSAGYAFGGWTGDCTGTTSGIYVDLAGPRTCGAIFTPTGGGGTPTYSLTIAPAPTGGSVSGNGLACGNGGTTCQVSFGSATTATLTATPASGYVFTSWGGSCTGTSADDDGAGGRGEDLQCDVHLAGRAGERAAVHDDDHAADGREGAGRGPDLRRWCDTCSVTMPASMTLGISRDAVDAGTCSAAGRGTAAERAPGIFVDPGGSAHLQRDLHAKAGGGTPSYALTIAPAPTGGSVSGSGLACGNGGTTCQVSFGSATTATLTAAPATGYTFTSWGGSCAGTSATTTVLVDAVKTCSATFTASGGPVNGPPYTMTITPPTGGKVQGRAWTAAVVRHNAP